MNKIFKHFTIDLNKFILEDETFNITMNIASELLKIKRDKLVLYNMSPGEGGWFVHPLLLKSVLRYVDNTIGKLTIAKELHGQYVLIGIDIIKHSSILSIAKNVKCRDKIQEKNFNGLLNKNDVFNDDHLITKCTKYIASTILISIIPNCLIEIIFLYL
jgi:hypothetical protein